MGSDTGQYTKSNKKEEQIISDEICTQANMLATFPLTTTRARRWWRHGRFLGWPDISTSYFARALKKGAVDLPYTAVVSIATGLKWLLLWRSWYFWHFAASAIVAAKPACLAHFQNVYPSAHTWSPQLKISGDGSARSVSASGTKNSEIRKNRIFCWEGHSAWRCAITSTSF